MCVYDYYYYIGVNRPTVIFFGFIRYGTMDDLNQLEKIPTNTFLQIQTSPQRPFLPKKHKSRAEIKKILERHIGLETNMALS